MIIRVSLTKEAEMAQIAAYHTTSLEYPPSHREVYHDHDNCPFGKDIKAIHKLSGTGGKQRCKECIKLD